MGISNNDRQKKFQAKLKESGLIAVTVWIHPHQKPDLRNAAELLASNPDLEVCSLRNVRTNRFTGLNKNA